jgi:hypothetical protein
VAFNRRPRRRAIRVNRRAFRRLVSTPKRAPPYGYIPREPIENQDARLPSELLGDSLLRIQSYLKFVSGI